MGRVSVGLLVALALSSPARAVTPITPQGDGFTLAVLRGRAVCLDTAGRVADALFGCNENTHRFGFAARDGKLYKFSATDIMTAMFSDSRVRERELQRSEEHTSE